MQKLTWQARGRQSTALVISLLSAMLFVSKMASAEAVFIDLRQATDMSLTLAGPDKIVMEVLGQLWTLPVTGGAASVLTPRNEKARHPRASKDGHSIVYQRRIDNQWDIWLLDLQTGQRRALTSTPFDEREPDFSSDQTAVVFSTNRLGSYDIEQLDIDSGKSIALTSTSGDARYPSLSDRDALIYVEINSEKSRLRRRTNIDDRIIYETSARISAPSLRPDEAVLLFQQSESADSQLVMLILSSDPLIRMATEKEDVFAARPVWLSTHEYLYTADGQIWRRELGSQSRKPVHMFVSYRIDQEAPQNTEVQINYRADHAQGLAGFQNSASGNATVYSALGDIWMSSSEGLQQLTKDTFWNTHPILDPSSENIVYVSARNGHSEIFSTRSGNEQPKLLHSEKKHSFAPALNPSGSRLAFLTTESSSGLGPAKINVLDLDSGKIVSTADESLFVISDIHWLKDNSIANLEVDVRDHRGRIQTLSFDVAMREVRRVERDSPQATPNLPNPLHLPAWPDNKYLNDNLPYVIQAGRLFDGVGAVYRRHVDIHIADGRIAAVVERNVLPLPEIVIDAQDLTVLPGFIDVHSHEANLIGDQLGKAWLEYGVTTIRELTFNPHRTLAQAESWESGRLTGPRLVIAPVAAGNSSFLDDPFGSVAADFPIFTESLRTIGPISLLDRSSSLPQRRYSPKLFHYQDVVSLIKASAYTEISSLGATPEPLQAARQQMLARMMRAGTSISIGSEAPVTRPGSGFHAELALLAAAGIPADQILRTATIGGALALHLDNDLGTVEAGKRADLVVIAGDPLADINQTKQVVATVINGRWIDRKDLENEQTRQ